MDTLRLVEVTAEGDLVLMTGDGRRFSLSVDEQVRSAVRRSRNGTHVAPTSDRPGPREVQSRIRAGADAEQVALQTGLDVDYVRRFEGPVLAERAHVAELAQATAVDRGGDPTLTLERVVLDVLTGEGHDVDDITWDSRRSDGTRWEVVVVAGAGTTRSQATWAFDTSTRSLEPVDGEAERLTGVERRRRLSAVRDTVFDVERPAATAPRGGTVDLLDALARQRGRRPVPAVDTPAGSGAPHAEASAAEQATGSDTTGSDTTGSDTTGSDTSGPQPGTGAPGTGRGHDATQTSDGHDGEPDHDDAPEQPGAQPGGPDQEQAGSAAAPVVQVGTGAAGAGPGAGRRGRDDENGREVSIEPDLLTELDLDRDAVPSSTPVVRATPVAAGERRSRRARRSAVPSWDEIVFGAKREDG
ncbi:septation protein SepH [Aquipuribacter sp. MA13-13]|uniref:septation protein SepH n=1 Tax=Aquipuribacter sp. MA13-13 TaxID=3440840 RepID=UPI003EEA4354